MWSEGKFPLDAANHYLTRAAPNASGNPGLRALVLVGGLGTRLRPLTLAIPKQLIPIAGKPMLYHVLDLLPQDTEEIVCASGYKADVLSAFLASHPPRIPCRAVPEAEPLGTGGGMRNAGDGMSDPFFLLNSDVITELDANALTAFHRAHGGVGTMSLAEVEDTKPYGVAALEGDDRIVRFVEKPEPKDAPSHWINAGLGVWNQRVLDRIPRGRPVSWETEIVPGLLAEGIYGFRLHGFWEDAGTPERLLHAQKLLFDAGRGGPGTLPPGAKGKGPVAFGNGVVARDAAFGGYVHLGERVTVGPGAYVENSIVMEDTSIAAGSTVSGSILGSGVRIGPDRAIRDRVLGTGVDL